MLSDAEKTDARRFLGYPVHGVGRLGTGNYGVGWPFTQAHGVMEARLNLLSEAEEQVARSYICTLRGLERAIPEAGAGLDTGSAAGWVRNPAELAERNRLFDDWRRRLCGFLGVQPGPGFDGSAAPLYLVV